MTQWQHYRSPSFASTGTHPGLTLKAVAHADFTDLDTFRMQVQCNLKGLVATEYGCALFVERKNAFMAIMRWDGGVIGFDLNHQTRLQIGFVAD